MKKYSLFLLFFFNFCFSQPILTSANFDGLTSANSYYMLGQMNPTNGSYANVSLVGASIGTSISVPLSSIPNATAASNFSLVTYAERLNDHYYNDLQLTLYDLYQLTNSSLKKVVVGNSSGFYNNYDTLFNFPFTLGQVSPVYGTYEGYYPSFTTPFGTYSDVIKFTNEHPEVTGGDYHYRDEYWATSNPFKILIHSQFVYGPYPAYYVVYNHTTTDLILSNSEYMQDKMFSVFSDNINEEFVINNKNKYKYEIFVSIYDVLGKEIFPKQKIENEIQSIDSSGFASGLYILKITKNENQLLQTDKILKN